jgi:hypothetical protein
MREETACQIMADWDLTTGAQWTAGDIEPEAREATKLAARKAGVPIGTWLSQTILKTATAELKHSRNGSDHSLGFDTPHGHDQPAGRGPLPAPTHAMVIESIQRLARRIEEAEQHAAETLRPLAEKVSILSQRIEEVGSRGEVSMAPMERVLMRVTERLERLEFEKGGKDPGRRGFFSR